MRPLRDALRAQDRSLAERLAHTLKGVAGSIGASTLEAQAAALEEALRHGAQVSEIEPLIRPPEANLAALVQALQTHLPALADENRAAFAGEALASSCQHLADLLAQQDFEAEDYFAKHRAQFQMALGGDYEDVKLAMERFNFEQALTALKQACGKKAIHLKPGFVS